MGAVFMRSKSMSSGAPFFPSTTWSAERSPWDSTAVPGDSAMARSTLSATASNGSRSSAMKHVSPLAAPCRAADGSTAGTAGW